MPQSIRTAWSAHCSRRRGPILWACFAIAALVSCRAAPESTPPHSEPRVARTEVDRGPVSVTVEVAPDPARLSDEPTLTLTIAAAPGVRVDKPPFGDGIGDFLILGFREPLPEIRDNREIIRQIYTLEATRTGRLMIDPISIVFHDERPQGDGRSHRIETESLEITIESVIAGEMASLDDLQGMAEPVGIESPGISPIILWTVAATILLAVAVGWWLVRRPRVSIELTLTPYEVAMKALAQLAQADPAQREVKRFYVELTGIVRRYIEQTTTVQAAEQTTEEFLREISTSDQFERGQRDRLKSFLESADLVKFAAHLPTDEDVEEAVSRARDFIRPSSEEVAA